MSKQNKVLDFFIKTLNGMAYGLFATLIIGTIFQTIASLFKSADNETLNLIYTTLNELAVLLQKLTGAGIGIGIALSLKYDSLKTTVLAAVGEASAYFSLPTSYVTSHAFNNSIKPGDPLTVYLVVIATALIINLVHKKKTPVDIILVPLFGITVGFIFSLLIRIPAIYLTYGIQYLVNVGTNATPFVMGIVISVLMGMALTAPISSAAIAAIVFKLPDGLAIADALANPAYSGLVIASGAAIIGCSTQMIGFAVQSRKDNNIGMVISVGIGTSMLQFKNILKKPIVWLPTIIASAILGPIATCVCHTYCIGSAAGMGTAGLVGQIGTINSMGISNVNTWISIIVLQVIAPAVLVFVIDLIFRKLNLIKDGDLTI